MEENNSNLKYWIIIGLLVIVIVVLLFLTKCGKEEKTPTPTGNIDVFDININCECKEETDGKKECTTKDKNGNTKPVPTFDEDEDQDVTGEVFVDDKNGNYIYQENLAIFENPAFEYTNKIAPGSSNTYNFEVHNNTNVTLKYYVEMYEETEYSVNLKYRLKKEGNYVIGSDSSWVTADELKTAFSNISSNSSDKYSLDWKWEYEDGKDTQDTIAGTNMTSEYKLNIRFYFEQVD